MWQTNRNEEQTQLTNAHVIGSRDQVEQHCLVEAIDKVLIPLLCYDTIERALCEGLAERQWIFVELSQKLENLLEYNLSHI